MITEFSYEVQKQLGYYVYAYFEPHEQHPFYIGKGKGNRVFSHLLEAKKLYEMKTEEFDNEFHDKVKIIKKLFKKGIEPRIEILYHGLDEKEAKIAEALAIDLFSKDSLTNIQRGYRARQFGRIDINSIIMKYDTEEVAIDEEAILIKINKYIDPDRDIVALYDRVRSCWAINKEHAERAKYVFAVYKGKILEIYEPAAWLKGCATMRFDGIYRDIEEKRIEFVGRLAPQEVRIKYRGKRIKDYAKTQNPCQYVNC